MLHLVGGARDGSNRTVVAQNLVAHGAAIGHGIPGQSVLIVLELHLQVLRRSRRSHVTLLETRKTNGVLDTVDAQGAVNIATDPQGAGGVHEGLPDAEAVIALNGGGEFGQHLTGLRVEGSHKLHRMNHGGFGERRTLGVRILVQEIAAVASTVESITFLIQVQILEVATITGNRGVGRTHIALVVARDEVLRTTNPDSGSGVLNVELEAPDLRFVYQVVHVRTGGNLGVLVRPVTALLEVLGNICHAVRQGAVQPGKVTGHVHVRVILGGADTVHGAVKHLAPVAVDAHDTGHTIGGGAQLKARDIAGVCDARVIALLDVGEGATDVHVVALAVNGLHHELIALNAVGDAHVFPLGGNLTGGGVHDHETREGAAVYRGEVAADCQTVIRQGLNRLDLAVERQVEVTAQLAGLRIEARDVGLVHDLAPGRLQVLEITADEHGGGVLVVLDLGDGLNVGVHLVGLAAGSRGTRAPAPGSRTAIGQLTTLAGLGTLHANLGQLQVALGQLGAQEHLGVAQSALGRTLFGVDVGVARIAHGGFGTVLRDGGILTVAEANAVILLGHLLKEQSLETVILSAQQVILPGAVGPIAATVLVIRGELVGVLNHGVGPDSVGTQGPGPLGGLAALHGYLLPLGAGGVQHAAEAVTIGEILRRGAVEQLANGGARKLHRGRGRGQRRVGTNLVLVERQAGGCGRRGAIQLSGVALTLVAFGPTVAALSNLDPAAAVGFLIAVELGRCAHGRGVQPVGAALCLGIGLLSLPTAGSGTLGGGAVVEGRIFLNVRLLGGLLDRGTRCQCGKSSGHCQRGCNAEAQSRTSYCGTRKAGPRYLKKGFHNISR